MLEPETPERVDSVPPDMPPTICHGGNPRVGGLGASAPHAGAVCRLEDPLRDRLSSAHARKAPKKCRPWSPAPLYVFACGHDTMKADGIAATQRHALKQHYPRKLRLTDIKEIFAQMRDQL